MTDAGLELVQHASRQEALSNLFDAVNTLYLLVGVALVFVMQVGFAMLTAGSVRTKNVKNVLTKNICDALVTAIAYYLFGYAFAYGDASNVFLGHSNFALSGVSSDRLIFVAYQMMFAAAACTIVSGCVCERISFYAYLGYAFLLTAFVQPVVTHWIWSSQGWASAALSTAGGPSKLLGQGAIDFAGDVVVHIIGGFAGLIGSTVIGPRLGRFNSDGKAIPMPGHSATLVALGAFMLWFGWIGFNGGSTIEIAQDGASIRVVELSNGSLVTTSPPEVVQRAVLNTFLGAAGGGLTALLTVRLRDRINDLTSCLNGMLSGLVSVTASCALIEPYAAIVISIIGSLVYVFSAQLILLLGIDDPLEAFPVHGAAGLWGILATGLFSVEKYQAVAGFNISSWGAFYGGGGALLGANFIVAVAAIGFVCAILTPFFLVLKVSGLLRISADSEMLGTDLEDHGGAAYPEDMGGSQVLDESTYVVPPAGTKSEDTANSKIQGERKKSEDFLQV